MFGQPREPWLEVGDLQSRFLAMSATCHPDRFHEVSQEQRKAAQERFALINAAFSCLRNPKARLLHLLELETGAAPGNVQEIPHGTTELFMEVNHLCREVDQFLKDRAGVESPLLRVSLFQRSQEWLERMRVLGQRLLAWREELHHVLREISSVWRNAPPPGSSDRVHALPLARLEQLYRLLSYEERWSRQVEERLFQLTA